MLRLIKYMSLMLFFTMIILIGTVISLVRMIDPNQYKSEISEFLSQVIRHPVSIDGELSWAIYPRISIAAHGLHLENDKKLKNPLELKTLQINLRLLPLLSGNLEITSIALQDLDIHFLVDKNGKSNLQFDDQATQRAKKAKPKPTKNKEAKNQPAKTERQHHLIIEDIVIKNAKIDYDNKQTGQYIVIDKLSYHGQVNMSQRPKGNLLTDTDLDGQLAIGSMDFNQIHIDQLTALFKGHGGEFNLSPIKAKLYQGQSTSNVQFNCQKLPCKFNLNETFHGIQMNQVFQELGYQKRIHGSLKGKITLNADDINNLPLSLNGKANIEFNDGSLKGVDILHIIELANAIFHHRKPPNTPSKGETPFQSLTGDIVILHGDIMNENFKLISPALMVTGEGHIDLNHWMLEYRLNAQMQGVKENTQIDKAQKFLGGGFPLIAKGHIDNYKVSPDMEKILKQAAKYFIKHEVGDKVDDFLKKGGDNIRKTIDKEKKPIKKLINDIFQ